MYLGMLQTIKRSSKQNSLLNFFDKTQSIALKSRQDAQHQDGDDYQYNHDNDSQDTDYIGNQLNDSQDTDQNEDYRYSFLSNDNNPLSRNIGEINKSNTYTLHLCIYYINIDCTTPFIQFLLTLVDVPQFPVINEFKFPHQHADEEINTYFMNTCYQEIIHLLKLDDTFGVELAKQMYKGFVQQDDHDLFVVFECLEQISDKSTSQWVILDELIFKKEVDGKLIHPSLITFFQKHKYMMDIFIKNSKKVYDLPLLLYLCYKEKDTYTNYTINHSLIDNTFDIPFFGDYYYFSSNIIHLKEQSQVQKYAVFIDNTKYILKDIVNITSLQKQIFLNNTFKENVLTIYFRQNNIQLWCVKNSNNFTRI